jgi:hypothetical protein
MGPDNLNFPPPSSLHQINVSDNTPLVQGRGGYGLNSRMGPHLQPLRRRDSLGPGSATFCSKPGRSPRRPELGRSQGVQGPATHHGEVLRSREHPSPQGVGLPEQRQVKNTAKI